MGRPVTALLLPLAMIGEAGCGASHHAAGTPAPSAAQQVKAAALRVEGEHDARVVCGTLVTARFVREVYGSAEPCVLRETASPSDSKAIISAVRVSGPKTASVVLREAGGKADGVTGPEDLVRSAAGWRLDRYETPLLRSLFVHGFDVAGTTCQRTSGLTSCLAGAVARLPDARVRSLAFTAARDPHGAAI